MGRDQGQHHYLSKLWYLAGLSRDFKFGTPVRRILFGDAIVFGRDRKGRIYALRDQCPHRGAPLSAGSQKDFGGQDALHCPYHGWAFDTDSGACVSVPALSNKEPADFTKICVPRYQLHEKNGLVWIYHGVQPVDQPVGGHSFPELAIPVSMKPRSVTIVDVMGPFEEAVTGLVDPAHTPYVHQQWWWRKGRAAHEKVKFYEPIPLGFRMPAHAPSGNSLIYKFLGGAPTTQIDFLLPGIRVETIRTNKNLALGLTAITPVSPGRNRITNCLFWDLPALTLLKPIIDAMAASFLAQDGIILNLQAENILSKPQTSLYLGEPDTPAKWYRQLSQAWQGQMIDGDGPRFENPLHPAMLQWKT